METNPSLTIALALAAGIIAQSVARHVRLPGIVLLLAVGVLLGPDGLGWIDPRHMEGALHSLVGFAVAVIVFEGGLNLEFRRLRRSAPAIRRLVTLGGIITALGGAVAARFLLEWDWRMSILFGSLVIVTGPTVVTPLLRRIKVKTKVQTILEAEGVFIDAVGAVLAVAALGVATSPDSILGTGFDLLGRYGSGILIGAGVGWIVALLLRLPHAVPEGLENVFALALMLAGFQVANAWFSESGIVVAVIAGLVVGNVRTNALADLKEFKEQLTVLLIGMLFVLLAADVKIEDVRALGWPGLLVVAALMFIVRPINVIASTVGTDLTWRERAFISWIAPRGIVAAAVASLFADTLANATPPIEGGAQLRALVFLVIAATVLVQGLSGGMVAQWLGVRRARNVGIVIVGANDLALALGRALREAGEEVIFIDSNPLSCRAASDAEFRVLYGNALSERVLQRAELDTRASVIAATPNEEFNLLFCDRARNEYKVSNMLIAVLRNQKVVDVKLVEKSGCRVLFGAPRDLELWNHRMRRNEAVLEWWEWTKPEAGTNDAPPNSVADDEGILPLAIKRDRGTAFDDATTPRSGDQVCFAISNATREDALQWFLERNWTRVPEPEEVAEEATEGADKA